MVRADMRHLPFGDDAFDGLTSFFTSFGYFHTVEEDLAVVHQARRCLRSGGSFMLDFFNARKVREHLVPLDVKTSGDLRVTQSRAIEDDVVIKQILIEPIRGDAPSQRFEERVRLYDPDELAAMLSRAGLVANYRFGDYGGSPFTADSGRLILAGHAL